jgi:hypothetical protein
VITEGEDGSVLLFPHPHHLDPRERTMADAENVDEQKAKPLNAYGALKFQDIADPGEFEACDDTDIDTNNEALKLDLRTIVQKSHLSVHYSSVTPADGDSTLKYGAIRF